MFDCFCMSDSNATSCFKGDGGGAAAGAMTLSSLTMWCSKINDKDKRNFAARSRMTLYYWVLMILG